MRTHERRDTANGSFAANLSTRARSPSSFIAIELRERVSSAFRRRCASAPPSPRAGSVSERAQNPRSFRILLLESFALASQHFS
jgi:hypothetical protein